MRAHPLPEAQAYAELMLHELRKVIPSFLRRVDLPDRGGQWSDYLESTRTDTAAVVDRLFGGTPVEQAPSVTLVDWDPDAEDKLLAAICYSHANLPEQALLDRVRRLGADDRVALIRAYVGDRQNRRHKPGRAFERVGYRFDVLSDYGAFRDLQRHRLLTIEWQRLTPYHGYVRPDLIDEAGLAELFDSAMARSAALHDVLRPDYPEQASYAVAMAYRLRYVMQFNAREGDPPARAPLVGAGASGVPTGGTRDAPSDRGGRRASRDRRCDGAHDDRGSRARTARVERRAESRRQPR
jgi:hypothetical protein